MRKFEYYTTHTMSDNEINSVLQSKGEEGWELVIMYRKTDYYSFLVFKREKHEVIQG